MSDTTYIFPRPGTMLWSVSTAMRLHTSAYVCKAGLVKAEIEWQQAVWSNQSRYAEHHERGGRYVLHRVNSAVGPMVELARPEVDEVAAA